MRGTGRVVMGVPTGRQEGRWSGFLGPHKPPPPGPARLGEGYARDGRRRSRLGLIGQRQRLGLLSPLREREAYIATPR